MNSNSKKRKFHKGRENFRELKHSKLHEVDDYVLCNSNEAFVDKWRMARFFSMAFSHRYTVKRHLKGLSHEKFKWHIAKYTTNDRSPFKQLTPM